MAFQKAGNDSQYNDRRQRVTSKSLWCGCLPPAAIGVPLFGLSDLFLTGIGPQRVVAVVASRIPEDPALEAIIEPGLDLRSNVGGAIVRRSEGEVLVPRNDLGGVSDGRSAP